MKSCSYSSRASMFVASTLFVTVFSVSCDQKSGQDSQEKIYGGKKVDKSEWLNVVAITDRDGIFCTGTAINPYLVITAAHCLEKEDPNKLQVYVGTGKNNGLVKGQYDVASLGYSPLYRSKDEESDHDVGYVILRDALDLPQSAYIPLALKQSELDELLAVGKSSTIIGFGERSGSAFGLKYLATSLVTEVSRTEVSIGGEGRDACSGDSGGPAFGRLSNGEWRVYGVVSRGGECGTGGIWGLIHANICWIQQDTGINLNVPASLCREFSF